MSRCAWSGADVVERAGSSVGSLYHHFGGKSELFLALYQEHQFAHEEAAREAVAAAKQAGETDATELFCAGARAFLDGTWQRRDLALLFFAGDGPPGFEVARAPARWPWPRPAARPTGSSTPSSSTRGG